MNFWPFALHGQCLRRKPSTGTLYDQKEEAFFCNAVALLCVSLWRRSDKAGGWSLSYCSFEATSYDYILTGRIAIEALAVVNNLCEKKCICFMMGLVSVGIKIVPFLVPRWSRNIVWMIAFEVLIKKVILVIICQNQHSSQPVKPFLVFTVRDTGSITIKSAWPVLGSW